MPKGPDRPAEAVDHQHVDLLAGWRCLRRRSDSPPGSSPRRRGWRRSPTPLGACRRSRPGSCRTRSRRRRPSARCRRWCRSVRTISARRITTGGDAQCHPITSSGREVTAASWPIGNPDVFDARIVSAGAAASRSRNTCCLSSSFSGTASTTRSTSAASSNADRERQPGERGVGVLASQLSALDAAFEAVATGRDVLEPPLECTGVDVVTDGLVPRGRRHLRDPGAHDPRPQHADLHPSSSIHCRVTSGFRTSTDNESVWAGKVDAGQPEPGGVELVRGGQHRLAPPTGGSVPRCRPARPRRRRTPGPARSRARSSFSPSRPSMNRSASPRSTRWRCIASWIWSNVGMRRRPIWVSTWSA